MDPTTISLSCTLARALAHLDDVEMYFKNPRIRRTVESLLNSFTTMAKVEETLRLTQLSPSLEALFKESEEKIVDLNRNHAKALAWRALQAQN